MNGSQIAEVAGMVFCASIFVLGVNIPLAYYAFEDEGDSCMEGTRGGLDLELWAKTVSLENFPNSHT